MPKNTIRRFCAVLLSGSLLFSAGSAVLAAGTSADPLLSQAYLEETTKPFLLTYLQETLGTADTAGPFGQAIQEAGEDALAAISLEALALQTAELLVQPYQDGILAPSGGLQQVVMSGSDTLLVPAGGSVVVLSGQVMGVSLGASTVIDVMQGREFAGDWLYGALRRLVVSEKAGISFETLDASAVLLVSGGQLLPRNAPVAQYTDLAEALMTMGLFRGTDTGLRLERTALRGEALTLLVRLLGKEGEALAVSKPATEFSDVPAWLLPYAAYGVKNSLTNGIGQGMFGNYLAITANEYMTFLLRALGYTDKGANQDFFYREAMQFAVSKGIFSQKEANILASGGFTRDKLVYISYYTLFARTKSGTVTLLQKLLDSGAVSLADAERAISAVNRIRP